MPRESGKKIGRRSRSNISRALGDFLSVYIRSKSALMRTEEQPEEQSENRSEI